PGFPGEPSPAAASAFTWKTVRHLFAMSLSNPSWGTTENPFPRSTAMTVVSKKRANVRASRQTVQGPHRAPAASNKKKKQSAIQLVSLLEDTKCVIVTGWAKWNRIFIRQSPEVKGAIEVVVAKELNSGNRNSRRKQLLIRLVNGEPESNKLVEVFPPDDHFDDPVSPNVTTPFPATGVCSPPDSQCIARLESTLLGNHSGDPPQSNTNNFSFTFPAPGDTITPGNYILRVLGTPPLEMNVKVSNP